MLQVWCISMSSSLSDPINPKSRLCQRSATCTGWNARLIAESLTRNKGFTTKARGKICRYCVSGYTMVYSVLLGILPNWWQLNKWRNMMNTIEHHWKPLDSGNSTCFSTCSGSSPHHMGSSVQLSHRQLTSGWHSQVASELGRWIFMEKFVATLQYPVVN
jgi:hypothetical protein